ncbi:hypothetical protein SAMN05444004_11350 [Jannaschia faecimaris]|uniref:Uncharacterized protein n=1 Tax=Jannaschia faecimaris TaxID=1244108 RepID=A0A1H3SQY2_9RHOB|nr:YeeE/YedE family protein [Jannaschia faecimaris]SDZ40493.1 hypothetical protein SAMN05444004_11350 [Jannaschia faecimaris]
METLFTPVQSLLGGALIGLAAVMLMGLMGRIMGATGILAGIVAPSNRSEWTWRTVLLIGMVSGPAAVLLMTGAMPPVQVPVTTPMLILGGLTVGIGVTFGSGCTSGHGVCGMARLSPRSIVATVTFMIATAVTVYVIRHVIAG